MSLEKLKLSSGLTIINDPIRGARTNDITIFIPSGSIHEKDPDEVGILHVLEHSTHAKTEMFTDRQALHRFDRRNGIGMGANTSSTRTLYYANGMEIEPNLVHLSQVVQHPVFSEDAVEQQLIAVRNEMIEHLENTAEAQGLAAILAMFGKPYGRSVGGYYDNINFTPEDVKRLHAKYYKLARMTLVVSGAAKLEDIVELAEQYFQPDDDPTFIEESLPPVTLGEHHRTGLVRDGSRNVRVRVGYPMPLEFKKVYDDNRLVFGMAELALQDTIFAALRDEKGLSYGGAVGFSVGNHANAWNFGGAVNTSPHNVEEALSTFTEVLAKDNSYYDEEDLQGVLASYKTAVNDSYLSNGDRASFIISRLESNRETQDLGEVLDELDTKKVADIRWAIDEIVKLTGVQERYTHLTGAREDIGDVDRMIDEREFR